MNITLKTFKNGLFGDFLGAAKYLVKKNPGKYQLSFERNKITFEEKIDGVFKKVEEIEVFYV